jgi:leader peptidase (prepilin peptidase)/N-methyltransferase
MTFTQQSADRIVLAVAGGCTTLLAVYFLQSPQWLWAAILGWLMAAISISDARRFIVPDVLSLPAIPAGLLASGYLGEPGSNLIVDPLHLVGMTLGAVIFLGIRQGYKVLRQREGLGLGDVKLAAVAGAWNSLDGLLHVVLAASLTALVLIALLQLVSTRKPSPGLAITATTAIPFGAFLAPAIWLVYMLRCVFTW